MYPIQNTRGGEGSNLNSPSISSNKSKFFKPVVASSLALFLTAGIASATCNAIDTSDTSGAKNGICFDGTTLTTTQIPNFKWENVTGATGVVSPKSDSKDINILLFQFNTGTTGSATDPSGAFSNGTYTIKSGKEATTDHSFKLDSGTNAIKIPGATDDAKGVLEIDFGEGTNTRSFELKLDGITSQDQICLRW